MSSTQASSRVTLAGTTTQAPYIKLMYIKLDIEPKTETRNTRRLPFNDSRFSLCANVCVKTRKRNVVVPTGYFVLFHKGAIKCRHGRVVRRSATIKLDREIFMLLDAA